VTPNPATAIPAGKVTLNFNDPTTPSQSLTLDATGSAKYTTATLHAGTYSNIVAIFPGSPSDPNNQGSVSAGIQQVVNQNGYTINWPTPTAIPYGTALSVTQLNATAPLADPTSGLKNAPGTFAYTLASGSPALGVIPSGGTQTLTATFTPTDVANFTTTANTAQVTLTVTPATPLLTLSPSNAVYYGTPIPFTATFSRYPTGTGVTLPTGTVTFYNNGTTVLGTSTIAPDGTASIITATPAALPVTTGTASNQITASWTDTTDTDYTKPITSAAITQVVNLIPTATSLTVETAPGSTQTILVAVVVGTAGPTVAAPQGTVFFVGTNGGVVSKFGPFTLDASGIATATPIGTGTYSFVAEYTSTDNIHGDSSSSSQTVTLAGGANDFGINTSSTVTLAAGQNSPGLTVTLQSLGTFTDTIGLGCASLPNGVNCHFTPSSVQLAAGGSSTAQLVIDTGSPLTGGAQSMNTRKASRGVSLAGLFLPVGVLFGLVFWRFRKRHALFTSLLLLLLAGTTMLVTSCGGLSTSKVAAGTYTIYVTGTGSATGVVHYQKVTLTIN